MGNDGAAQGDADETPAQPFPEKGPLVGVDYGRVRIGIAICDNRQQISSPLDVIVRRRGVDVVAELRKIINDYEAAGLVIGLPLHTNGDESEMSREATRFGRQWATELKIPVTFFDERYTSAQAEDFLLDMNVSRHKRRHGERDMLAAHYILASFLQAKRQAVMEALREAEEGVIADDVSENDAVDEGVE